MHRDVRTVNYFEDRLRTEKVWHIAMATALQDLFCTLHTRQGFTAPSSSSFASFGPARVCEILNSILQTHPPWFASLDSDSET